MRARLVLMLSICCACMLAPSTNAHAQKLDFDTAASEAKKAPLPSEASLVSSYTKESLKKDEEQYLNHILWQRDYVQRAWNWHFWSTVLLFLIVVSIVAFGLVITYLQFHRDYGVRRKARVANSASPSEEVIPALLPTASSLKISPAGMEITSQVIGLLVLGFSLAFFYFYVKDVYPIQEYNLGTRATRTVEPKSTGQDNVSPVPLGKP